MYPSGVKEGALVPVHFPSIYAEHKAPMGGAKAFLAPDAAEALMAWQEAMVHESGRLFVSDMYRSTLDQAMAYIDYLAEKTPPLTLSIEDVRQRYPALAKYVPKPKKAFSTPPGFSMHESGRAIDIDMNPEWLGVDQNKLAEIAQACGWRDIVHGNFGNPYKVDVSEEWHWEFLGPFARVMTTNMKTYGPKEGYRQTAAAAISSIRIAA